jgi:hypothetical protein
MDSARHVIKHSLLRLMDSARQVIKRMSTLHHPPHDACRVIQHIDCRIIHNTSTPSHIELSVVLCTSNDVASTMHQSLVAATRHAQGTEGRKRKVFLRAMLPAGSFFAVVSKIKNNR